jgi:hypothetical protein
MTFVAISLSSAVAKQLRAQADEDARRERIAAGDDLDDFVDRRIAQRLEAAYSRRT